MPNKKSRLSLSQVILHQILFHCDLYQQWASPNARRRAYQEVRLTDKEWRKILADRERKRTIIRLRKKKWIQDKQRGIEVIIKISKDAVVQELKRRIRQTEKKMLEGKMCLVLFDFPNGANTAQPIVQKIVVVPKSAHMDTFWYTHMKDRSFHMQRTSDIKLRQTAADR